MGKLKTHKGLKKRVKVTARGKIIVRRGGHGHLMTGKTGRNKRLNRTKRVLEGAPARAIILALTGH